MAFNKFSLASHVVVTAKKSYLMGVSAAVAFRLQGVVKAVEARDLVEKAAGEVDAITAKAVKSLMQNISNQWSFAGEVLAKLSADERKAIKACGDNGAIDRIGDCMTSHMAILGFEAFTLGQLREYYAFNSADEVKAYDDENAAKLAAGEPEGEAEADAADATTTETPSADEGHKPVVLEMKAVDVALAAMKTANDGEIGFVIRQLASQLGTDEAVMSAVIDMLATVEIETLQIVSDQLPHIIRNRRDAAIAADMATIGDQMAA